MHFYNRYNIMLIRLSESWIGLPDSKCNYLEPNMFFVGYQIHWNTFLHHPWITMNILNIYIYVWMYIYIFNILYNHEKWNKNAIAISRLFYNQWIATCDTHTYNMKLNRQNIVWLLRFQKQTNIQYSKMHILIWIWYE